MASNGMRTIVIVAVSAMTLHCQSRERRPIVVAAPAPGTAPGAVPGNIPPPGPIGGQPGVSPDLGNGQQPGVGPMAGPVGPGGTPGPGVVPGGIPPSPNLMISTTLEDGTTVNLEWDGRSFKGNDKWDVGAQ